MEKERINIEELFRQSFDGYRIEPPETLWSKLSFRLGLKQFLKPDLSKFNIYYSALMIGISVGLVHYLGKSDNLDIAVSNSDGNHPQSENLILEDNKPDKDLSHNHASYLKEQERRVKQLKNQEQILSKEYVNQEELNHQKDQGIELVQNFDPLIKFPKDSDNHIMSIVVSPPKPLFSINAKEGCAPFELKISNLTSGALEYLWSFGDGTSSLDKSPVYTYQNPGIYKVQLRAKGAGGVAYSFIDSIVVHEKPGIRLFWPYGNEFLVGEKIHVPINASHAKIIEWDFGDGSRLRHKQPEYSYKQAGEYTIVVRSWSDKSCYDSVKVAEIKVIKSENKIIFPNAFYPNPAGPSSGHYYERETHVDIFHPVSKGNLVEYKLMIYARSGAVIFESDDVKIGWDGYYESKLMPEGVYPYVVTGKFEGGENFLQRGNLTVIHRK